MEKSVLFDLEQNRKRLNYFFQLKEKAGSQKHTTVDKWIEIYSERMRTLEHQAQQLGLKTDLSFKSDPSVQHSG